MSLRFYDLDRIAENLVRSHRDQEVLNETHKMRVSVSFGLERFWGEHLRLQRRQEDSDKADYWRETWRTLVRIMGDSGIVVPNVNVNINDRDSTAQIREMANHLWDEQAFPMQQRKVVLAVLMQLCDSMIWWAQRYKKPREAIREDQYE
jgi:hypothetical protein